MHINESVYETLLFHQSNQSLIIEQINLLTLYLKAWYLFCLYYLFQQQGPIQSHSCFNSKAQPYHIKIKNKQAVQLNQDKSVLEHYY